MPTSSVYIALLISLSLCLATLAQLSQDQSIKDACESMSSSYSPRSSPDDQAAVGDLCAMQWNVYTSDEQQAREFCQLYAPWRLNKVEYGTRTVCHVEATLMCQSGWTQMFGRCLKIPGGEGGGAERFTYDQALETCAHTNPPSQIASLRQKYIVGVWTRLFPKLEQTWVHLTPSWEQYRVDTSTGGDKESVLMIVGDSYDLSVMSNSLVYIDKKAEFQVLCEYEPPVTRAEINYLARRYQEIYYKGVEVSDGVLIRTSSYYQSDASNPDVCKRALKPYKIDSEIGNFVPLDDRLKSFDDAKLGGISFSLAHGKSEFLKEDMQSLAACRLLTNQYTVKIDNKSIILLNTPSDKCDNMRSTVVSHLKPTTAVKPAADSLWAPMWCQLGKKRKFRFVEPPGWKMFVRENGEAVVHKVMDEKKNFFDALAGCKEQKAVLSGFDSMEEARFLQEILRENNMTSSKDPVVIAPAWIGLYRRFECDSFQAFVDHLPLEHACSKRNVMHWSYANAHNPVDPGMWGQTKDGIWNPDFSERRQRCGTVFVGVPWWAMDDNPGMIDDNDCTEEHRFFCSKGVEIVEEDTA